MERKGKKYVAYYRVSTGKQKKSGLGLEAQRQCVEDAVGLANVVKSFQEAESGKKSYRPMLQQAIEYCTTHEATLVIAKLDRLSRNISFIFALRDSGIDFFACDLPECNTFNLAIFAAMAQHESELISKRTKDALARKKERIGGKLHNNLTPERREIGYRQRQDRARSNPNNQRAIGYVRELQQQGLSLRNIADRLNKHGFKSTRGGKWYASSVKNLLKLFHEIVKTLEKKC